MWGGGGGWEPGTREHISGSSHLFGEEGQDGHWPGVFGTWRQMLASQPVLTYTVHGPVERQSPFAWKKLGTHTHTHRKHSSHQPFQSKPSEFWLQLSRLWVPSLPESLRR